MPEPKSRITGANAEGYRLMSTSHGAHPPELWAQATAEHIAPISDEMTGPRRFAAMMLQAKIAEALTPHHELVQTVEATNLAADPNHHLSPVDPSDFINEAMGAIQAAAKGTDWEAQFSFGAGKPVWYDAWAKKAYDLGAENAPLTAEQQAQIDGWDRENLIRQEIGRHFATAQHIARSLHRDSLKKGN